jgi:DNA-binding response OmpR family regulator
LAEQTQPPPKTVLICDDDANLRTLVRLALGDGFHFVEAPDGHLAVVLARQAEPDLIVLDLMLPGQSGLDVLSEIRQSSGISNTPVIVVSAWSYSDDEALAAGANRFLAKPFEPDDLRDAVVELLAGNGAR